MPCWCCQAFMEFKHATKGGHHQGNNQKQGGRNLIRISVIYVPQKTFIMDQR